MDRRKLSRWILVSAALAFVLLLCDADLLTWPFMRTHEPHLPTVLSVLPPIGDWMGLGAEIRQFGQLLFLGLPLAIFIANLTILILAQERRWRPRWLAWIAFSVPAAILASVLMVFAASLQHFFTSTLPWGLAGAVLGLVMLGVAKRKGWRPLWPWWLVLLFSGSYVFLVLLAPVLERFGVVHHLL